MIISSDRDAEFLRYADDAYFRQLKRFKRERFHLLVCGGLTLVAVAIGIYMAAAFGKDLMYYYQDQVIDLGDVRTPQFDPAVASGLMTNDHVTFRNDVVMFDGLLKSKENPDVRFYYSPVTNLVVRTTRPIPPKPDPVTAGVISLTPWELDMVVKKKAFAWDLKSSFDGDGRVLSYDDLPLYLVPVAGFFSAQSDVPEQQLRFFLDREIPPNYAPYTTRLYGAAGLVVATIAIFAFMLYRYLRERRLFLAAVDHVREGMPGGKR